VDIAAEAAPAHAVAEPQIVTHRESDAGPLRGLIIKLLLLAQSVPYCLLGLCFEVAAFPLRTGIGYPGDE
jgi:hypothetical protein